MCLAISTEVAEPAESAQTTDTLKLCPHEEFLKLQKEMAGEVFTMFCL